MSDTASSDRAAMEDAGDSGALGFFLYFLAVEEAILLALFLLIGPRGHDSVAPWLHATHAVGLAAFVYALAAAGRALRTIAPAPYVQMRRALVVSVVWLVFYAVRSITARLTLDLLIAVSRTILLGWIYLRVRPRTAHASNENDSPRSTSMRIVIAFITAHVGVYVVGYLAIRR